MKGLFGIKISLADKQDLSDQDNFCCIGTQLFHFNSGKTSSLHFTKSMSQQEILLSTRDHFFI